MLFACVLCVCAPPPARSVEDRQRGHLHLWDRQPPGPPRPGLHEETRGAHAARCTSGRPTATATSASASVPPFCSVCPLQWLIDSGATSNWNEGSSPDARGLACLRKHGIDSDHRAAQVYTCMTRAGLKDTDIYAQAEYSAYGLEKFTHRQMLLLLPPSLPHSLILLQIFYSDSKPQTHPHVYRCGLQSPLTLTWSSIPGEIKLELCFSRALFFELTKCCGSSKKRWRKSGATWTEQRKRQLTLTNNSKDTVSVSFFLPC